MKGVLYEAAQDPEFNCLSPLAVFKVLDDFVKRVTEYDFLKQDVRDGYHDAYEFINVIRTEYLATLDQEVRDAMGIFERTQYEDYLKKYILHLSHLIKNEKIKNSITGKQENPDQQLLEEFETIVEAPKSGRELDIFRQNVITAIGAYSLDHPNQPVQYRAVFPEFMTKLENYYFEQQKSQMVSMSNAIGFFGTEKEDTNGEFSKLARRTLKALEEKAGYCENCAKSNLLFLIKQRY